MRGYFYRGRHRKPTQTSRKAATIAVTGAVGFGLTPTAAFAAQPDWGPIIACESSGDPRAQNPSSSASGLFQFLTGTWRAYGGLEFAPTAAQATIEQQYTVANRAFAAESYRPWNSSKSCWQGRVGSSAPSETRERAQPRQEPQRPATAVTSGRAADGSGTYVCDSAHLHFEACDPHNLGETVDYPLYTGRHRAPEPATPAPAASGSVHVVVEGDTLSEIAAAHDVEGGWPALHQRNRQVVGGNPHLIFPGQRLDL